MLGFHKSGHIWYDYCVCMYGTQVSVMAVWMKKFKREAIQVFRCFIFCLAILLKWQDCFISIDDFNYRIASFLQRDANFAFFVRQNNLVKIN